MVLEGIFFMDVDVLIIGGNLTGLLSSYIFREKNTDVCLLEKNNIEDMINKQKEFDIVTQNQLMLLYNSFQAIDYFQLALEGIYKLANIINNLGNDCDFIRNPSINFMEKESLFVYKFGTSINAKKLMNELLNYHKNNEIPLYENSEIKEIEINKGRIIVALNNKQNFTCKKLLICDRAFSELYFDVPISIDVKEYYSLFDTQLNTNISIDGKENTVEYKYYLTPIIGYHVNPLLTVENKEKPFIDIHNIYPDVYFNIANNDILLSIMGSIVLGNKFLEVEDNRLRVFKSFY